MRRDGWTTIRFSTDFGESAFSLDDLSTSASFWYRGDDEVLKSSYNDLHMFQFSLNPFGYAALVPTQLKGLEPLKSANSNEVTYNLGETTHDNGGKVSSEYVLSIRDNLVYKFKRIGIWDFPKVGIVGRYDDLTVEWSELTNTMGVPAKQVVDMNYGIQSPKPEVYITVQTHLTSIDPLPPEADTEQLKADIVAGLFQFQSATPPRRMPDAVARTGGKPATSNTWIISAGAICLLMATWFAIRNRRA